jgi:hypothetical protein
MYCIGMDKKELAKSKRFNIKYVCAPWFFALAGFPGGAHVN